MKTTSIIFSFLFAVIVSTVVLAEVKDCEVGWMNCDAQCGDVLSYNDRFKMSQPEFQAACEKACVAGQDVCKLQDAKSGCDTFFNYCVEKCPGSKDDKASLYQCLKGCGAGRKACAETTKSASVSREKTGVFDACGESPKGCRAVCMKEIVTGGFDDAFADQCLSACGKGAASCPGTQNVSKDDAFYYACVQSCPDMSWDEADQPVSSSPKGQACINACTVGADYGKGK